MDMLTTVSYIALCFEYRHEYSSCRQESFHIFDCRG